MKKKLILAAPLLLLAASTSTVANPLEKWNMKPYLGVEGQVRHMPFKENLGHNLFKKDYAQGNGFVGIKFMDKLGIELGYEQGLKKTARSANPNRAIELGVPLPTFGRNYYLYSFNSLRIYGPHASVIAFFPFCICDEKFEFVASVGAASLRIKAIHQPYLTSDGPISAAVREISRTEFKKRKTVLRAMGGLQYMMTKYAGVRASVAFEKTSKFRNIRPSNNVFREHFRASLHDSLNYGLALFVQF